MVWNFLGKFLKNLKIVEFPKRGLSNRNFRKFKWNEHSWSQISESWGITHRVALFSRNSGKCCSRQKFLEIQTKRLRRKRAMDPDTPGEFWLFRKNICHHLRFTSAFGVFFLPKFYQGVPNIKGALVLLRSWTIFCQASNCQILQFAGVNLTENDNQVSLLFRVYTFMHKPAKIPMSRYKSCY